LSLADFSHGQFLWLMVSLQLFIFSGIWILSSTTARSSLSPVLRYFGLFNFTLGCSLFLVAMRGTQIPDFLTQALVNLMGVAAFVALWAGAMHLFQLQRSLREPLIVLALSGVLILGLGLYPHYASQRIAVEFLAIAWLVIRACSAVSPVMRSKYGLLPYLITWFLAVMISSVLTVRALGGLFGGWNLLIERDRSATLAFTYLVLASLTTINSVLAFVLLRSVHLELARLASHDPLTGLLNRRAFSRQQGVIWNRWSRNRSRFATLCLDIDHFKSINDQYGHDVGDQILVEVAEVLKSQLRPMDILARTGGEEFAVVMDISDAQTDVVAIAERIRSAVQSLRPWPGAPDRLVTISVGIATPLDREDRPEQVFVRADHALYRAKHKGRNCVEIDAPLAAPGGIAAADPVI